MITEEYKEEMKMDGLKKEIKHLSTENRKLRAAIAFLQPAQLTIDNLIEYIHFKTKPIEKQKTEPKKSFFKKLKDILCLKH